jgi:hypothetical protein
MIRINLLKSLQAPAAPVMLEEASGRRKPLVLALAGIAVLAAGISAVLMYPSLLGGLLGEEEAAVIEAPAAPAPDPSAHAKPPKRVTANAVEEIVREVQAEQERSGPTAGYNDLVPSEKIEYQYFAATRILRDIKSVTPPDIGFAHFIFSPPGDFYVHGLAYDEETYRRFQEGLATLEGAAIRPGLVARGKGRVQTVEFSFYGTVKYPVNAIPEPPDRVVSKQELQAELKQLGQVASTLGIRLKSPRLKSSSDAGEYRKLVYQASADCSYQQMQDLLGRLQESRSNLGFLKFALKAEGDDRSTASLDILAYVD